MTTARIALIISSTRDGRFADKPAAWLLEKAKALRPDVEFDVLDLRDFDLPFFNEAASNLWVPSTDERALKWQEAVGSYDGFIALVAEYNSSITAALKNALDQAGKEWVRKPMATFGYGAVGAARAIEHLRTIIVNLQMVPVRSGVNVGGSDFFKVSPLGANEEMSAIEGAIGPSVEAMLNDLVWWTNTTKAAREETLAIAAE